MELKSIYSNLERNAKKIPNGINCKFIFRHSIRHPIKTKENFEEALLTDEGIEFAKSFGEFLDYEIGYVASSGVIRCIQTLEYILSMRKNDIQIEICKENLEKVHISDDFLAEKTMKSLKKLRLVINRMQQEDLTGFNNLNYCAKKILDYIFQTGNKNVLPKVNLDFFRKAYKVV